MLIAAVVLDGVSLRVGDDLILDRVSLDIADGELMAIIGPSGSGKTSILRLIAGLDSPSSGAVLIDGEDVGNTPTRDRDVAMVFQDAVLYPSMRAEGNVGFPLRLRDVSRDEVRRRVQAEGRALEIEDILKRWPRQLSAGHQQLVQVARAMIRVPAVFLLDEPLARVDARLRTKLRGELRFLQRGYGVTTVYVTNDPVEAMAVGDRIAVIDDGRIQQVGPPLEVYERPATAFVAGVAGERPMNLVEATVEPDGAAAWVRGDGFRIRAWAPDVVARAGEPVTLGVRPEDIEPGPEGDVGVVVEKTVPHGSHVELVALLGHHRLWIRSQSLAATPGDHLRVRFVRWHVFGDDGRAIAHVD